MSGVSDSDRLGDESSSPRLYAERACASSSDRTPSQSGSENAAASACAARSPLLGMLNETDAATRPPAECGVGGDSTTSPVGGSMLCTAKPRLAADDGSGAPGACATSCASGGESVGARVLAAAIAGFVIRGSAGTASRGWALCVRCWYVFVCVPRRRACA